MLQVVICRLCYAMPLLKTHTELYSVGPLIPVELKSQYNVFFQGDARRNVACEILAI